MLVLVMFLATAIAMLIVMICCVGCDGHQRGGQSRLIWMDMDWTQTYQIGLLDSGQGQLTPSRETGKDGDKDELSLFMKPS